MAQQKIFLGTELKLNINIEPMNRITMDDYDFEVELICGTFNKSNKVIKKEQAKRVDSNNYIVCFDTAEVGAGKLKCKVTAFLPDDDFEDGKRTEVVEIDTGIEIIKGL